MSERLYDTDVLAWSAEQADLLRRLARGARVNGLDWENVIEEIEDVGKSERNAVRSPLQQALVHLLKIHRFPQSGAIRHWSDEVLAFLDASATRYTPSMMHAVDLEHLYQRARSRVEQYDEDGMQPRGLPAACPFVLSDLMADRPSVHDLLARITDAAD